MPQAYGHFPRSVDATQPMWFWPCE